ncbi:MAG: hypothetical protein H6Q73_2752 [Firmicutes bacterium]|nr:hypothetical protein [Bacillota bacterium]
MRKINANLLSEFELMGTIIGWTVAVGLLSLPASVVSSAKQDGWIAVLIGAVYPFYVILFGSIIIKYYPNITIMDLSKKFLGKVFGNLLNFLFMAQWLFYLVAVIGAANNLLIVYSVWFMTPLKITLVYALLLAWGSTKGLKILAKMDVAGLLFLSLLLLSSFIAFTKGDILNIQPVFDTPILKLLEASKSMVFAYANMELLLVIHPFVKNKKKIVKVALISVIIVIVIYLLVVVTALLFFGPDIVPTMFWPFYFVSEGIKLTGINNFRYILMIFWPLIIFRNATMVYYAAAAVMGSITGMANKKWCILFFPVIFLALLFENEVQRRDFIDKVIPWVTIFNVLYVLIISLIALVKNKRASRKKTPGEESVQGE